MSLMIKVIQLLKNYNKKSKKIEELINIPFESKTTYDDDDHDDDDKYTKQE